MKQKILKEINYNDIIIKLYEIDLKMPAEESISNIKAFNSKGDLIWIAEKPTYNTQYFNIQIDEDRNLLEADSGAGRIYLINLKNGRIDSSFIIK